MKKWWLFCNRCTSAEHYYITDTNRERGEEDFWEYQLRILKVDKSRLKSEDGDGHYICEKCGHVMVQGNGNRICL